MEAELEETYLASDRAGQLWAHEIIPVQSLILSPCVSACALILHVSVPNQGNCTRSNMILAVKVMAGGGSMAALRTAVRASARAHYDLLACRSVTSRFPAARQDGLERPVLMPVSISCDSSGLQTRLQRFGQ